MKFRARDLVFASILFSTMVGCRTADPAAHFIASMDGAPVEKRPKNWEETKSLMARSVPEVGQLAPDFSLPSLDGAGTITRSAYQSGRPLVLIFGSFT
jgi:hypothetical protein